ncbi:unnamed protein product [Blepharisma stoltei]|uniref:PAS domain-containing protein n=1 Tax=Blepharisma stoltei TaxID=1481888 RepID=A0AAU9K3V3_9CILI|nr:unnamed protein product [Blepharisma stoltei]
MKFLSKNEAENFSQRIFSQKSGNWYQIAWNSLVNYLVQGFKPQYSYKIPYKIQLLIELISNSTVVFQIISLFWYPVKTPQNWKAHSSLWNDLSVFNYDYICKVNDLYKFCYYGQIFVIFSSVFAIIIAWVIKSILKKVSKIFIRYSKAIISVSTRVSLIPSLKILLVIFKYSAFDFSEVQEYKDTSPDYYNYGLIGLVLSFIGFILLLIINFAYELLTADLRHFNAKRNISARSHSSMNLWWIVFCAIEVTLYLSFDYEEVIGFMIFTLITSAILLLKFLYFLPYYNSIENSIYASKITSVATGSLSFLLGYLYDDAYPIIFIFVFFTPFAIILLIIYIIKRHSKLQFTKNPYSSQYNYEKSIRHLLSDKHCKNIEEVIEMLSQFSNSQTCTVDGLFVVWKANFYIDIAKDERLAMVKLAQINNFQSNLEGWIQKYRISNKFHQRGFTILKEIEYLQYLKKLHSAKNKDKELCYILLDIYIEILNKNTRIIKLRYLIKKLYCLTKEIKELYKFLVENYKYPDSFEFYAYFLIKFLGQANEGNILLKRKQSIKEDPIIDQGLEEYGENIGVIFLSTESDLFGTIAFINARALSLLKVSSLDAIGKNFDDFIPAPYSLNHIEKMKTFLKSATKTIIEKPFSLFLQDNFGYIFECNISVKLTAFKDKAYFLISFSPISSNRQVILISEEGEICNHSSQLSALLGYPKESMKNMHFHSLINELELSDMELYNPTLIQCNNHDLVFIHITEKVKSIDIHLILVISDNNEQELWKNKKSEEQLRFNAKQLSNCPISPKINSKSLLKKENETFSEISESHKVYSKIKNVYKSLEENFEVPKSFSQVNKNISPEQIAYKNNKRTAFLLQKFQWILFLTVFFLVAINIGILVYIVDNVSNSDLSAVFSTLGNIELSIGLVAILGETINDEVSLGKFNLTRDLGLLYWTYNHLNLVKTELMDDFPKWSNCPCSDIVTENIVPIWEFNSGEMLRKYNLYDALSMFIDYTQKLMSDAKSRKGYEDDIKWLMINGVTYSLKYVHKVSKDLLECEKNTKSDKSMVINVLFIIGILICAIFIALLMAFGYFLKTVYDKFWSNLKKSVTLSSDFLKSTIFERLLSVHSQDSIYYDTYYNNSKKLSSYHIKTTLAKRLFYRLSLIIIISLCFYLVMIFFLYKQCQESMIDRSRLLQNFKFRSILISRLALYIKEINDNLFLKYYPESYAFTDPYTEFYKTIDEYDFEYKKLLSSKWDYLLSKDIKESLFESTNYPLAYMKFGLISASELVISDSLFLSRVYSDSLYSKYYISTITLQSGLSSSFTLADASSKDYIDSQLNSMVSLTILFSAILGTLSLFYYLPYLRQEKKFLDKACFLLEIIMNSKENQAKLTLK